jgi:hypothetical protein
MDLTPKPETKNCIVRSEVLTAVLLKILESLGTWHCIAGRVVADILDSRVLVFMGKQSNKTLHGPLDYEGTTLPSMPRTLHLVMKHYVPDN